MRIWALLLSLTAAACSPDYPFDKPGTWHLKDGASANDANLWAMVVDPHDLVEGVGTRSALASEASPPIKRLLTNRRTPLQNSNLLQLLGTGAPPAAAGDNNVSE